MEDNLILRQPPVIRILASTLLWAISAVAIAAAISFFTVFIYALVYVPRYAIAPALVLGLVHSIWMHLETNNHSSSTEAQYFSAGTGVLIGLLGFAPTFINFTEVVFQWKSIYVFVTAAAVGGGAAGLLCAAFFFQPAASQTRSHWAGRLVRGFLIVVPLVIFEALFYAPTVRARLPVPAVAARDVLNLRPGTATGNLWSGEFQYSGSYSHGSSIQGTSGGMMRISQQDGRITVSNLVSKDLIGGIDADGRFWAGGESSSTMLLRTEVEGEFTDQDHFNYSVRSSVFKDGAYPSHINSTLAKGSGTRWKAGK